MSRKKIVAGNWKMHGSLSSNAELVSSIVTSLPASAQVGVVVFPPFPYLAQVAQCAEGSALAYGAQNLSAYAQGAYTGEVAAGMLKDLACAYVLVGHSERRALYGETDEVVAAKFAAALAAGLIPVLCVGETLAEREANETLAVVGRQLQAVIDLCGVESLSKGVVAYEPVWAIGTGKTATPEQAQDVHAAIRQQVAAQSAVVAAGLQILYGGSVKADNAAAIFTMPDIDGGLVGGASLQAADFLSICRSACLD